MLVRHERLVSFMGAGEMGGYRFLVVELMTGGSIEKKLWGTSQNTLTKHTRLLWAHDVALGLDIVHSKNFVHRDLKTPNILFDATTLRAKIADFGLGKSLFNRRKKDKMPKHDDGDETKTSWSKCVMTGNAGSVLWMAPEVMSNFYGQGAEYGGSVDVYVVNVGENLDRIKQENHSNTNTDTRTVLCCGNSSVIFNLGMTFPILLRHKSRQVISRT